VGALSPTDEALDHLLRRGAELWRDFLAGQGSLFHGFIPADHRGAYEVLARERAGAHSFLELGSGLGVITVLADQLGFDAYGIEIEPELVDISRGLNDEVGARATFALGSFVPEDFRDEVSLLDAEFHTPTEGADGYDELGMDLASFDLVYAYPWPGQEEWMEELVRRGAGPHTRFMTYSVSEGFEVRAL
jgi:hypothetical protein